MRQRPFSKRTSKTPRPCAFFDFCTFSAVQSAMPSVDQQVVVGVLVVDGDQPVRRRVRALRQRKEVHAVVEHARLHGLLRGDWLASGLKAGAPAMIGSPQALTTCHVYPCGTTTVSAFEIGVGVKPMSGPPPIASCIDSHPFRNAAAAKPSEPRRRSRRVKRAARISAKESPQHSGVGSLLIVSPSLLYQRSWDQFAQQAYALACEKASRGGAISNIRVGSRCRPAKPQRPCDSQDTKIYTGTSARNAPANPFTMIKNARTRPSKLVPKAFATATAVCKVPSPVRENVGSSRSPSSLNGTVISCCSFSSAPIATSTRHSRDRAERVLARLEFERDHR